MDATTILAFKMFVSAAIVACLLNMYIVQQLKILTGRFRSGDFAIDNLRWVNTLSVFRKVIGDSTISYMRSRTLLFPLFELTFATLAAVSLYTQGLGVVFIRTGIFLTMALPLAIISWQDDPGRSIAPNLITYTGTLIGILTSLIPGLSQSILPYSLIQLVAKLTSGSDYWTDIMLHLTDSILGGLVGGGFLWLIGWLWERLRGVEAMGLGAVKSMMMIGTFSGVSSGLLAVFLGVVSGSIFGVVIMFRRGERDMQMFLPFVSFLVVGGVIAMLWGDSIVTWYVGQFKK